MTAPDPSQLHPLDVKPLGLFWYFGGGYSFVSDLLRRGALKPLDSDDVPPLPRHLRAGSAARALAFARGVSLRTCLWRMMRWKVFWLVVHGCMFLVVKLSTPLVFWWLLLSLGSDDGSAASSAQSWAAAVLLGVLCYFISVYIASGCYKAVELATLARQSLSALMFSNVLRLPSAGANLGDVSSVLSLDTERVFLACNELGFLTPAVGMLVGGAAVLAAQAGLAAIASLVFLGGTQVLQQRIQASIQQGRRRLVAHTSARVALSTQFVQGIRAIRMNGWDPPLCARIEYLRGEELDALRRVQRLKLLSFAFSTAAPMLCTMVVLGALALIEGPDSVTPARFFVIISIVNPCIRSGMDMLPRCLNLLSEGAVALNRMQRLLDAAVQPRSGLDLAAPDAPLAADELVRLEAASFSWPGAKDDAFTLQDISLRLRRGDLICVLGEVGSGKSALCAALLGELPRLSGVGLAAAPGGEAFRAALCGQQPWIRSLTVRENVVLADLADPDLPAREESYQRAVEASQLLADIKVWPDGDAVEVGERGLTLSGGQKARVALARAAYAVLAGAAELAILDDVLAALDGQVAQAVVDDCLLGLMSGVARVVTLSSPHPILSHADAVYVMERGRLRRARDGELAAVRPVQARAPPAPAPEPPLESRASEPLHRAEQREVGGLRWNAVQRYFGWAGHGGRAPVLCVALPFLLTEAARVGVDAWLALWASLASSPEEPEPFPRVARRWGLLLGMGMCAVVVCLALLRSALFMAWAHRCSHSLFGSALRSVARASVTEFFDTTPSGRLVNSFSRDVDVLDSLLPDLLHQNLVVAVDLSVALLVCVATTPTFIVLLPPLLWYAARTRKLFGASARELKRLDGVTRAPVLTCAIEVAQGILPLRALAVVPSVEEEFLDLLDRNGRFFFHLGMLAPWMVLRMNTVATFFVFGVSLSAVALSGLLPSAALGIGVAYSLNIMGKLQTLTRYSVELEQLLTSAERLDALLDAQPAAGIGDSAIAPLPKQWPEVGRVQVQALSVRYRDNLPLVLRDVSFCLEPGTKMGVVGRSGCGKSTLMQALLRLVEPAAGSVSIDGVDIGTVPGDELRRRVAVIPQEPYLWSGTLRANLDPIGGHADAELLTALERCRLGERFGSKASALDFSVGDSGCNLSVGERQLLCLCRALLKSSCFCMLDEATANIDASSEARVQEVIAEAFERATVVVVAHRLQTVRGSDVVLRLDAGRVAALGPPSEVLGLAAPEPGPKVAL